MRQIDLFDRECWPDVDLAELLIISKVLKREIEVRAFASATAREENGKKNIVKVYGEQVTVVSNDIRTEPRPCTGGWGCSCSGVPD